MSFQVTLMLLGLCCVGLLVGFSYRAQRWSPWLMLMSICGVLALMAYSILELLPGA